MSTETPSLSSPPLTTADAPPDHTVNSDADVRVVTFVIPTIGRKSLSTTLQSLRALKIPNGWDWRAIIVFDGVKPTIEARHDVKLHILQTGEKLGKGWNSAGLVRNYGIKHCTSEWVAFVDDDDIVTSDYLQRFVNHLHDYPDLEVVIFKMFSHHLIHPTPGSNNFRMNDVGISFCARRYIFDEVSFRPSDVEDFRWLDHTRSLGTKMAISRYVTYIVRPHPVKANFDQYMQRMHMRIPKDETTKLINYK